MDWWKIMNDNWAKAFFDILKDQDVNKEIKLFIILDLLHDETISLHKAQELCTECGLFSNHWMNIDVQLTEIWPKYFKN